MRAVTMDFNRLLAKAVSDPGAYAGTRDGRSMGTWMAQAIRTAIVAHAGAEALSAIEAAYENGRSSDAFQPKRGAHGYRGRRDATQAAGATAWVLEVDGAEIGRASSAPELSLLAAGHAIESYPGSEPSIMNRVACVMRSTLEQVIFTPSYRTLLAEALAKEIFAKTESSDAE